MDPDSNLCNKLGEIGASWEIYLSNYFLFNQRVFLNLSLFFYDDWMIQKCKIFNRLIVIYTHIQATTYCYERMNEWVYLISLVTKCYFYDENK